MSRSVSARELVADSRDLSTTEAQWCAVCPSVRRREAEVIYTAAILNVRTLIKITVTHRIYSAFLSLSRNSKLLVHWFLTNILWFYSITCHIIPLSLGSRHSCQLVREEQHAVPTVIRLIHGPVDEIELKLCFIFKPSSSYGRAISPAKHSRSGRIGHSSYPRLSEVAHGSS